VDPAEGEVHERCVARDQAASSGLGGDGALVRDLVEEERLEKLRFRERRRHLEQGFLGEEDTTFRDGPNRAGESQPGECLEHVGRIPELGAEVVEVIRCEAEGLQRVEAALQAAGDQEAPVGREVANEQAEGGGFRHPSPQVGRGHVQLVEIGGERVSHRGLRGM
jgi:hypothetical protein